MGTTNKKWIRKEWYKELNEIEKLAQKRNYPQRKISEAYYLINSEEMLRACNDRDTVLKKATEFLKTTETVEEWIDAIVKFAGREEIWYDDDAELSVGPMDSDDSIVGVDFLGLSEYAKAKGVDSDELTQEERNRFIKYRAGYFEEELL